MDELTPESDPERYVLTLNHIGCLGYVRASDEWMDGAEPLPDHLQVVAHQLVRAGRLPEFEEVVR